MKFNHKKIKDLKDSNPQHIVITPLNKTWEEAEEIRKAFGALPYRFNEATYEEYKNEFANYYLRFGNDAFSVEIMSGLHDGESNCSVTDCLKNNEIHW